MFLEIIGEIIFELFLEGSLEASMNRKVPPLLRIILITAVILVYAGLLFVIISIAIQQKSITAWIIAGLVLLLMILGIRKKYQQRKAMDSAEKTETVQNEK